MDFREQFEEMSEKVTSGKVTPEAARVMMLAQERHNHARDQLASVLAMEDKGLMLGKDGEMVIEAGTDMHKGVLIGISIALEVIGEFPIDVAQPKAEGQ